MTHESAFSKATPKLELLWEQTFDAPDGTLPDPKTWTHDIGDGTAAGIPGWGNQEREWYTDSAASIRDGKLVFTATKLAQPSGLEAYYGDAEWASAKIHTKGKAEFKYGRIEATIKAPTGAGTWPAFWMLGTDIAEVTWPECGEIDILEMRGRDPHTLISTVHGPGYCGEHGSGTEIPTPALNEGFHTFGVDWLEDSITWHFDGKPFHTVTPETIAPNRWAFNHPHYIIMNLAMGGGFTGNIDPELTTAEMVVESVRFYSLDGVGAVMFKGD
jgi:beta-glucanase (GH16 family)